MKRTCHWLLTVFSKAVVIILVVLFLPFAGSFIQLFLPDINGEIRVQSSILEQKLTSSKRLEVTSIDEEGVLTAETNVVILGTVGSTTIRYRYTASIGIDLSKVIMTSDTDRIIFSLPDPEILNDGIEALEVTRHDLFSKAIDKSVETLLNEQRIKCREQYLEQNNMKEQSWDDAVGAFNDTICQWLDPYGERHYQFEFLHQQSYSAAAAAFLAYRKRCGLFVRLDSLSSFA